MARCPDELHGIVGAAEDSRRRQRLNGYGLLRNVVFGRHLSAFPFPSRIRRFRRMKRLSLLALAPAATALVVAGCGGGGSGNTQQGNGQSVYGGAPATGSKTT